MTAKSGGVQRSTTADTSGCYELKDLPPATYRVTARLPGFDNVTRDRIVVASGRTTNVDLRMRVSPICECISVFGGLLEYWNHSTSVLHVRLTDSEPEPPAPPGYHRHAATVLDVLKAPEPAPTDSIFVLQNQRSGTDAPYDAGEELVLFANPAGERAFFILNDQPGLAIAGAFFVEDGRIQQLQGEFKRFSGMPIATFLNELRALASKDR